jgi:hypothetical protein
VIAVTAAAIALALTAWNSSESDGSNAAASDTDRALLDFAQCMRDDLLRQVWDENEGWSVSLMQRARSQSPMPSPSLRRRPRPCSRGL